MITKKFVEDISHEFCQRAVRNLPDDVKIPLENAFKVEKILIEN